MISTTTMTSIHIRPVSTALDDGLRILRFFDSQLTWLSSIGSSAQWGNTPRSDQEEYQEKYRAFVASSERGWTDSWSHDWIRAYIAEVEVDRENLPSELQDLAIESPDGKTSTVRLPVAGMILTGKASTYVQDVIPENDDEDPFIYLLYLVSDRNTAQYGKGAGSALINHARGEVRKLDIKRICVDCWRGNDDKLVKNYEKQGFTRLGDFEAESWPGTVLEMRL